MVTRSPVTENEILLQVKGGLHGDAAELFQAELESLIGSPYRTITLDLREVPSINSSCIGRILLSRTKLAEQGRSIRIHGCSEALLSTFRLVRLDKRVPLREHP